MVDIGLFYETDDILPVNRPAVELKDFFADMHARFHCKKLAELGMRIVFNEHIPFSRFEKRATCWRSRGNT
jgi:hypothetical protein